MSLLNRSNESLADFLNVRTVLQRCTNAEVLIDGVSCGQMSAGFLLLIGYAQTDGVLPEGVAQQFLSLTPEQRAQKLHGLLQKWWDKLSRLRIFPDEQGRMNDSLLQQPAHSGLYLVSQFTLFADLRKGKRPSFSAALPAALAKLCFEDWVNFVRLRCPERPVYSGEFGADMKVSLTNDGPVTLLFDCTLQRGIEAL